MLLKIENLFFAYQQEKPIFVNFNMEIPKGKIIAIVGESGCGKSTLLNIIYGILNWQKGEITFEDKKLFGPKKNIVPGEKEMELVSQHYNLMPNHTVAENVGKSLSNINQVAKKNTVNQLLSIVGLEDFADVLPRNLSGGQQQRVAIAKALSTEPKLLLLDEPFSSLDFSLKIDLREKLFQYVKDNNLSLLISTHEIVEVMPWVDQIIVLDKGRLIQNDNAIETYQNPYNAYVAKLFGEVNLFTKEEKEKYRLESLHYYPHEIKISEEGYTAKVINSYFSGPYFWNKIIVDHKELIVYTKEKLLGQVKIQFIKKKRE